MSTDGDPTSSLYSPSDVDGDAVSDYIVGVPAASVAGLSGAGAVDVHYGSSGTQRFGDALFPGSGGPTAGAGFGSSIALTNLSGATSQNVDVCADLVIGAPGAGRGRGAIVIAQGSNAGVSATGSLVLAGPVAGARFGSVVVAYRDDIWVGAPDQPVDGAAQAGAVYHYRWADGSLTLLQTLTESTPGVPGLAEKDDHFGSVLAVGAGDELVIGEPDEDIGSHAVDAGTATVVFTSPTSGL